MAVSEIGVDCQGIWIAGESRAADSGASFSTVNPFDGSIVADYANGDEHDADAAIGVARRTFDEGSWAGTSARIRHDLLARTATLLDERVEKLATSMVLETGKPITQARIEASASARMFDYCAGLVLADEGEAINRRADGALGLVLYEPVGVAALITAWNYPMMQVAHKTAMALAAGCTVVVKPSHLSPASALQLAEILRDAGVPSGVFNVVTSELERGAVVGQRLAGSEAVDMISFTGSTAAGRAVMRAAAANIKRVQLELGGKSANIIFADAPLEQAARSAAVAFTNMNGQQCSAGSRLLVQREVHQRVVEAVSEHARAHVLGDPRLAQTTIGPLVNSEQRDRVRGYIELGREIGDLVVGGAQPATDQATNLFVEPTIFDNVPNSSRLAQEEVFGPVLSVIPFDTEAEAVAIANDSQYGLAGAVWTASIDRALRVVKGMRTGKLSVNCYGGAGVGFMPHGGYKQSGLGRENSKVGLREFQEIKAVEIKIAESEA